MLLIIQAVLADIIPLKQTMEITKICLGGIFMAKSPHTPEFCDMKLYGTIILSYIVNEGGVACIET